MMRARNPNFVDPSASAGQVRRIQVQVGIFMGGITAGQRDVTFDDIRQSLPPPDRNATDGVIHQALIDEGLGDLVES